MRLKDCYLVREPLISCGIAPFYCEESCLLLQSMLEKLGRSSFILCLFI